jgi:hypothetical protein
MDTVLLLGDCLEKMKDIPDNSIDSLVTDPPAGISFMNQEWDNDKGGRDAWIKWLSEVMKECLRVLKPGAHGLVWSIPRTSHWTATALEDAGFEVRDCITHLYGQGFPKSLDISKAIDKEAGVEREIIGKKSTYREPQSPNGWDCTNRAEFETAPTTDAAKQWAGYGTGLKPSAEFWWLIRKKLSEETIAKNVLYWGTGGLNIDGSRIGYVNNADMLSATPQGKVTSRPTGSVYFAKGVQERHEIERPSLKGRFPANLILSHHPECVQIGVETIKADKRGLKHSGGHQNDGDWIGGKVAYEKGEGVENGNDNPEGIEYVEKWECNESCPIKMLDDQS